MNGAQATPQEWVQPAFSGLAGWDDGWAMDPAVQTIWTMYALATSGSSFPLDYVEPQEPIWFFKPGAWDGDQVQQTWRIGFFGP